ncbi:DUF3667 domain-containing protein [Fulvivirgaceae bacterium PWU5]|uniref:DUF3667 domain-containing protein n=1 Tax=Dawidia cretensis TaxID=2782350 RepID=A0AAP2GV24_9BACT|nr:DUF3667 domain-containing protein [Dawidia cretensis]MBT1709740.1 DUF3667 domain-containing protein [Dawidia cretensis]
MSHKKYRVETNCLNCGAEVTRKFCPECGQENIELRDSFVHVVGHFISDYLHYDSKFFKGLLPLFTKPGYLTRQYLEGKRASNIHPLRLFFFCTIFMVLVSNLYYHKFEDSIRQEIITQEKVSTTDSTQALPRKKQFGVRITTRDDGKDGEKTPEQMMQDARAGLAEFFHNIKYISFFLLPVYALIFKLFYVRRKTYYVDHLIYTMHLQSFVYILISLLLVLLLWVAPGWRGYTGGPLIGVVWVYVAMSLRQVHKQSWWKSILKAALAVALCLFITAVIFTGYIVIRGIL